MTARPFVAAVTASVLGAAAVQAQPGDPLAAYQWRSRVLLVIADRANDAGLVRQRTLFAAMRAGAKDRDLALVQAIGPAADALRKRFGVGDAGFRAILIGKDGGDKLASDEPLGADRLFPLIDAMPMRQEEMRNRS